MTSGFRHFQPAIPPGTQNVDANLDLELVIISLIRVLGLHPSVGLRLDDELALIPLALDRRVEIGTANA